MVLEILDPDTGDLTFVQSVTGRSDIPLRLLTAHERLHWLSAPASGSAGACDLTRLGLDGVSTNPVVQDITCETPLTAGLDVLGTGAGGDEVWVYDGLAVAPGKTGFDVDVSDTQGNSVELSGVITVAAP